MTFVQNFVQWWKSSSSMTRILSSLGIGLVLTLVVVIGVFVTSSAGANDDDEIQAIVMTSETTDELPTPRATPSTDPTPTPSQTLPPDSQTQSPQNPAPPVAAPAAPSAPVFEAFSASASQYGIGQTLDNGPAPFPSGILTATAALPSAQGTGPITYSVSGLPTGAGFDANSRLIFIDTATFIPAHQQNYLYQYCYQKQRVSFSTTVQYTATGPGGQVTAPVLVDFGVVVAPAGMLRFGC